MIQKYKTGNLTWVDLNCPTSDEIRQVVAEYEIHPMVARELTIPTLRQKVDLYEFLSLCLKRGMSRKIQHHFPRALISAMAFTASILNSSFRSMAINSLRTGTRLGSFAEPRPRRGLPI